MNPVHPAKETELSLSNARPGCMDCVSLTNSVQNGKECLIYERELFCSMVIGQHNWSIAIHAWHVTSVRCIYLYIVVSPYVRGFPAYLHLYLYYILWPLAPR
jgi:hypothetical protein